MARSTRASSAAAAAEAERAREKSSPGASSAAVSAPAAPGAGAMAPPATVSAATASVCTTLSLRERTRSKALAAAAAADAALATGGGVSPSSPVAERARLCAASAALLVLAASRLPGATGDGEDQGVVDLSSALKAADVPVRTFFSECKLLLAHCGPAISAALDADVNELVPLPALAVAYAHSELLFHKVEAFAAECFLPGVHAERARAAVWLLYLAARVAMKTETQLDLVSAYFVTLCVQAEVLAAASEDALSPAGFERAAGGDAEATLANLCEAGGKHIANPAEIAPLHAQANAAAAEVLGDLPISSLVPAATIASGKTKVDADAALERLRAAYGAYHASVGGFDGRLMLERDMKAAKTEEGQQGAPAEAPAGGGAAAAPAQPVPMGTPPRPPRPSHFSMSGTPLPNRTFGVHSTPLRGGGGGGAAPPASPMSAAMAADRWLRSTLARAPEQPSASLLESLSQAEGGEAGQPGVQDSEPTGKGQPSLAAEIGAHAKAAASGVFPASPSAQPPFLSGESEAVRAAAAKALADREASKREAGVKLYYRVLDALLDAERQRGAPVAALTALVRSRSFHGALLACAFATVANAYKAPTIDIEAICTACEVTPFDVSKAVEFFIRYETSMPRELKRHLNAIDERALEQLAWKPGSSLLKALTVACGGGDGGEPAAANGGAGTAPAAQQPAPMDTSEGDDDTPRTPEREKPATGSQQTPERPSAFSVFKSPHKPRLGAPLPPAFAAAFEGGAAKACPDGSAPTAAAVRRLNGPGVAVEHFFAKVRKLAASRIADLCDKLRLPALAARQVYTVFLRVLYHRTSVFYNRHVDQVLLCAIYGVCKVTRRPITFRDIIYHYRRQPQSRPEVFRSVVLEQSSPDLVPTRRGDIIEFYNVHFVPHVKAFLLELPKQAPEDEDGGSLASPPAASKISAGGGAAPRSPLRPAIAPGTQTVPLSPLPKLPMQSPKKLAGTNVYASSITSSKKDALLMTPRSRSLYAFVGEPTHAYQSPSKDLSYINGRIKASNAGLGGLAGLTDVAMSESTQAVAAVVAAASVAAGHSPLGRSADADPAGAAKPEVDVSTEGGIGGVKRTRADE